MKVVSDIEESGITKKSGPSSGEISHMNKDRVPCIYQCLLKTDNPKIKKSKKEENI